MNCFQQFQLPERFEISLPDLKIRYQTLQKVAHPDKFASDNDSMQKAAVAAFARVNEAYDTLRDPVKRAIHLLALRGVDIALTETIQDSEFLEAQMNLQMMRVENSAEALKQLEAKKAELLSKITQGFAEGQTSELVSAIKQLHFLELMGRQWRP